MKRPLIQAILRSLLQAGAGALIGLGVLQAEEAEQLIGAILLIAGVVWDIVDRTGKKPGQTSVPVLLLLLIPSAVGCASYTHSRPIVVPGTPLFGYETTAFRSFLMMGKASKIKSATKDSGGYSRSVSVGAIEGQGDSEMVKALIEAGATAAAAGAKAVAK